MKLRNDKEINAFFASAHPGGAAVPAAPTEQNSPTVVSVNSACSVGGHCAAWLVHLRQGHPLGGWRGYGRMPYPPKRGLGFSPKPTLQPHFEYWVADDKLAWGIGGDKVFLCERFLQTCDIGSGAKTVLF